jgi:Holliday junction resolvase RusA-like endonuclease
MSKRFEYIPIKPMSVNEAWRGRRTKTPRYLKYQSDVFWLLPPKIDLPEPPYFIEFEFGFSSKASDLDNPTKQILDIISKKYKFNDNLVYQLHLKKTITVKGKEFIKFRISTAD